MQIFEHAELKDYLPPLDAENYKLLKESIKADGIRESLVVWNDLESKRHWLIDGYHRKAIADELDISYRTRLEYFNDLDSVKEWIIINQGAKRNFGSIPSFYISELVRIRTARAEAKTKTQVVEEVAEDFGISRATAYRAMQTPAVKMGYENKQASGDEYSQEMPESDGEYSQEVEVDYSQEGSPDEFSQEVAGVSVQKDGYVLDEFSQVSGRTGGGSSGKRKKKRLSITAEQKKHLREMSASLAKTQNVWIGKERLVNNFSEIPTINFKGIFSILESRIADIEAAESKAKFGKPKKQVAKSAQQAKSDAVLGKVADFFKEKK